MPGLDPGIHANGLAELSRHGMDRRIKPGDDEDARARNTGAV
jgi:hypothetical protein